MSAISDALIDGCLPGPVDFSGPLNGNGAEVLVLSTSLLTDRMFLHTKVLEELSRNNAVQFGQTSGHLAVLLSGNAAEG
jgi:hypothetical protein